MFTVINTIQSTRTDTVTEPVEIVWYKGDNLAQAISAMTQAAVAHDGDPAWVVTRSVRIDFS